MVSTIFCLLAFAFPASAAADAYAWRLESLRDFSTVDTRAFTGRPSLWVAFQVDCPSCDAQLRDLACLPPDVRRIAVGTRGRREALARVPRGSFAGPALLATPDFARAYALDATPTLLVVDAAGVVRRRLVGRTPCATLQTYFNPPKENRT